MPFVPVLPGMPITPKGGKGKGLFTGKAGGGSKGANPGKGTHWLATEDPDEWIGEPWWGGTEGGGIWMANSPNLVTVQGVKRGRALRGEGHGCTPLPTIHEDPWGAYYRSSEVSHQPSQLVTVFAFGSHILYEAHANRDDLALSPNPIMIASGASFSVEGRTWLQAWDSSLLGKLHRSSRSFKFGEGASAPSLGAALISLDVPLKENQGSSFNADCRSTL